MSYQIVDPEELEPGPLSPTIPLVSVPDAPPAEAHNVLLDTNSLVFTQTDEASALPKEPATSESPPAATKSVSEARSAASKANGSKSKGPKTPEGKSTSSKNSLKHGLYQKNLAAIRTGAFAEDPEELNAFVRDVMADLDPVGVLEDALALSVVRDLVQQVRIHRWEDALLLTISSLRPANWTELNAKLLTAHALLKYLEDPKPEALNLWRLSDFIVSSTPHVHEPLPGASLSQRFEAALKRLGTHDDAKAWATQRIHELEAQLESEPPWDEARAAAKLVDEMVKLGANTTRLVRNLQRRLDEFYKAQRRRLESTD